MLTLFGFNCLHDVPLVLLFRFLTDIAMQFILVLYLVKTCILIIQIDFLKAF